MRDAMGLAPSGEVDVSVEDGILAHDFALFLRELVYFEFHGVVRVAVVFVEVEPHFARVALHDTVCGHSVDVAYHE